VNETYRTAIESASNTLIELLVEDKSVIAHALGVDAVVRDMLRHVGQRVAEHVMSTIAEDAIADAMAVGLTVEHRSPISVRTLFGSVTVPSPYMANRATKARLRPVKAQHGLYGGVKTPAVERALVDFGVEESCELASKRFAEHYGQDIGRTSVLRVVKEVAEEAQTYVENRLTTAAEKFSEPLNVRPGVDRLLIELDGCMIRTGTLRPANDGTVTPVRGLASRKRDESWREVKVAFAREVISMDRTYVARMDNYATVVTDLFGAAVDRGLSERTQVHAVADGGNGLREELDAQFSGLTFLLDRMHLKSHLHETAEACGLKKDSKAQWVDAVLTLIDAGLVAEVITELNTITKAGYDGSDRARRLAGYLGRFQDALGYDDAVNAGLPIGSGEIESAHRYIPQKRLKIPGACWLPSTVKSILALRILRANDWWDDFWDQRSAARRAA